MERQNYTAFVQTKPRDDYPYLRDVLFTQATDFQHARRRFEKYVEDMNVDDLVDNELVDIREYGEVGACPVVCGSIAIYENWFMRTIRKVFRMKLDIDFF